MDLVYPALSAPLLVIAVRAFARWARAGGRGPLVIGVLASAGAVDAARVLFQRVEDVPGGGPRGAILGFAIAVVVLLVGRAWRGLAESE